MRLSLPLSAASLLLLAPLTVRAQSVPTVFHVTASASMPGPVSGRLLLFMKQGAGDKEVDIQEFHPADTWVAAEEVHDLAPGGSVEIDANVLAYPKPFREAPAGSWEVQAVLDPDHTYDYGGRSPADWETAVVALPRGGRAGANARPPSGSESTCCRSRRDGRQARRG